ncbi:MAG: DUF4240 domain-containing protein [Thermoanaerobaculia bacterium]|nr:DUF4240 domain-containing protein [Thermoanaerobaculia bacterium]
MDTILHIKGRDLDHALVDDLKEKYGQANVEIRVHDIPDAAGMFKENDFWNILQQLDWSSSENEQIIEPVVVALSKMNVANIYQFQDILSEKLWHLDTRAHANAFTDGDDESFLSADDFLYARCGVIANGKDFYELVLSNPLEMPRDITFAPLLRIAKKAYERKTGKKMTIVPAFNYETCSNKSGWQ